MMSIARRKFVTATAATAVGLALAASGCSQRAGSGGESSDGASEAAGFAQDSFIGVSLPQKTSQNWEDAEALFPEKLDALGFENQVQFANGGVTEQQNQINSLITRQAKALIVGPIDSAQLASQLSQAKSQGIPVISYDRMITNTEDVDYLVTFKPEEVGKQQGESLLQGLEEKAGHPAPYNVELFAGSPDDNNAQIFFESAMEVLQPKIDDGTLVVQSGQTSFQQVATQGWVPETAQGRMDAILTANYSGNTLDGVLSPNDTIARALITSIRNAGIDPIPPMTGQDSDPESIQLIHDGIQYSTVNKPTVEQVDASVGMVEALSKGEEPETNGVSDNGAKELPTQFLTPTLVTQENLCEVYQDDPVRGPIACA